MKRHRHEEPDDGLGLFADVISGTLGIIMLTALIFALRAATSANGIAGLPADPSLRSELHALRRDTALARIAEIEKQLAHSRGHGPTHATVPETTPAQAAANDSDLAALAWIATQAAPAARPEDAALADARLRDFVRQRERLADLRVLKSSADQLAASYRDRLREVREDFARKAATPLRLPREAEAAAADVSGRWLYLLVRGGRVHPFYTVKDGRIVPDTESNNRIEHDGVIQFTPLANASWPEAETKLRLVKTAEDAAAAGGQVVLLVHPESFALGRELVRTLDGLAVNFSWEPTLKDGMVDFMVDGRLPPATRK